MDRALDSLSSDFKPFVFEVLARLIERQALVLVVQTSRTLNEHAANVANGTSRTMHSKHIPRVLRGRLATGSADDLKADAIDLVPWEVWQAHGPDKVSWDNTHSTFQVIGEIGESLGEVRWGGRWHDPYDPGHLEWLFPNERYSDIPATSKAWELHGVHI